MRKYLLAAAATAALSCFAAPAMAQSCGGDQELTMNPDGTQTCGDNGSDYTSPLMSNMDMSFDISEEVFAGYGDYFINEVVITETESTYELTFHLEQDTSSSATEGGIVQNHTQAIRQRLRRRLSGTPDR